MRKGIFVGVAALLAVSAIAHAGTIAPPSGGTAVFSDNFESYASTAALKAAWSVAPTAAQGLAIGGGKGGGNGVQDAGGVALQTNFATQTLSDTKPIVVEMDQWDYSGATRSTLSIRGSAIYDIGIYNASDDGSNYPAKGTGGLNYSLRALQVGAPLGSAANPDGTGGCWWMIDKNAPRTQNADPNLAYHHFKAVLKATSSTFSVTLANGTTYSRTVSQTLGTNKNVNNIRIGCGVSSTGITVFDNVQVYTTPEPASMLLLGLGGLLLRRRRA